MKLEEKACNLILIVYFNCDLQYVFLSFLIVVAVNNSLKHMYIEQSSNSSINIHTFSDARTVGLKRRLLQDHHLFVLQLFAYTNYELLYPLHALIVHNATKLMWRGKHTRIGQTASTLLVLRIEQVWSAQLLDNYVRMIFVFWA